MDDKLTADILATCSTIGYSDEDKYYKDPECLASVKDLVLYLRRDDDNHSIRRLLGQAQVVHKDLLPLIKHYSSDLELYDIVLRLLVNLTNSALLVYEEHVPQNKTYRNYYHQITEHLQSYKQAFADEVLWKTIGERLKELVGLEWENRLENDKLCIERILLLIRNVLQVPADPAEEKRNDDDASIHDQIVYVMHRSGLLDLLLSMSSNSDSAHEYSLHLLEIVSLLLREQTGEQLAKTQPTRSAEEILKDDQELAGLRARENLLKSIQMKKASSRHSRFGGTFTVHDLKAASGRDILCHKPITNVSDLRLDVGKKIKRKAKNYRPLHEVDPIRRSTLSIRWILKNFCESFLKKSYNFLMGLAKDKIVRQKTQDHDETYYLWGIKFFMEFNRYYKFRLQYVSETMSTGTFHYVQTLLDNYHEMMVTDKEKMLLWSKRAHSALKAYQELLYTLMWMDKCGTEVESSRYIKRSVFFLPEYRELCTTLLLNFNPVKFSKIYFYDLLETNHLFLRMLEDYSKSPVMREVTVKAVRRENRNPKRVKPKKQKPQSPPPVTNRSRIIGSESPQSAALDEENEISRVLEEGENENESESGNENGNCDREMDADAHTEANTDMNVDTNTDAGPIADTNVDTIVDTNADIIVDTNADIIVDTNADIIVDTNADADEKDKEDEEEDNEEEEEEEDDQVMETRIQQSAQDFDFQGFLQKYANSKIIAHYGRGFQEWQSLKPLHLHCIMKMFHRYAFDMGYPSFIFQASIFKVFQSILNVPQRPEHLKEVEKFFYHIWPKFVKLCEGNKKMFMEILFWKSPNDAMEIQEGYSAYGSTAKSTKTKGKKQNSKFNWTEVEDNELEVLAEEYLQLSVEERKKSKIVDWINARITGGSKVKKTIKTKLTEKGFMDRLKKLPRAKRSGGSGGRRKKKQNVGDQSMLEHLEAAGDRRVPHSDEESNRSMNSERSDVSDSDDDRGGVTRSFGNMIRSEPETDDSDDDEVDERRRLLAALEAPVPLGASLASPASLDSPASMEVPVLSGAPVDSPTNVSPALSEAPNECPMEEEVPVESSDAPATTLEEVPAVPMDVSDVLDSPSHLDDEFSSSPVSSTRA